MTPASPPSGDAARAFGRLADALDDADFAAYAERRLRILAKDGALVPLRLNAAQRAIHAAVERQLAETGKVRALILKGRQQGASTYVEARYFWKLVRERGQRSFILTHSDPATTRLFNIVKRFHDNLPDPLSLGTCNVRELSFDQLDSGVVVSTAGSRGAGRAETLQLFHGSECAFWADAEQHLSGALQAVPDAPGTEVVLESTSAGPAGLFHAMCQAAMRGASDFRLIFTPWFLTPEYRRAPPPGFAMTDEEREHAAEHGLDPAQMVWRRAKVAELFGPWNFRREYPATVEEAFKAEAPGALWKREIIAATRVHQAPPDLQRIVVGVDPSGGGEAEAGIVAAGLGADDHVYVLDDLSTKASPAAWGARAVAAYERWQADRIVAEANYGGAMVEHTIRTVNEDVAVKLVTASRGKQVRAEPVAALYEQGRVHHVGAFAALEDELVSWDPVRSDRSPNRLDALVWAVADLVPAAGGGAAGWLGYYRLLAQGKSDSDEPRLGSEVDRLVRLRLVRANEHRRQTVNGKMFECPAGGAIEVTEAEAAALMRLGGWFRCGAGDGRVRVRWRDPGARHATFADGHLFAVEPGADLAVEEHEARLLAARGWVRVV